MQNGIIIEQPVDLTTLTPRYTAQVLAMLDYASGGKPGPLPDPVQPAPVANQPFFMYALDWSGGGGAGGGWSSRWEGGGGREMTARSGLKVESCT
jgi:hypothetical protein